MPDKEKKEKKPRTKKVKPKPEFKTVWATPEAPILVSFP
jgi:hypothetical protein